MLLVDLDPQGSATAWWQRRRQQAPGLVQADGAHLGDVLDRARDSGFQLVIIDTAPHASAAAVSCAQLADRVYIPTRPAILDLDAIGSTAGLLVEIGRAAQVVLNACPPPTRSGEPRIVGEARQALVAYGIPVNPVALSQRAAFSHALIDGRAVTEFESGGKAAAEIDALWLDLSQELFP